MIALGFVISFSAVALLLGAITRIFDFDPNILRSGASILLLGFGLLMIWPAPFEWLSIRIGGLINAGAANDIPDAIRSGQTADQLQDFFRPRLMLIAAANSSLISTVSSSGDENRRRDCERSSRSSAKRCLIAQRVQLLESVQKNVLDEVVDFRAWHASEENAVYEWRVKIVKPRECLTVAVAHRPDQHDFDPRLLRLRGGVWLGARQKHVGSGVHGVSIG